MNNTLINTPCALGRFPSGSIPKNHASAPWSHASVEGNGAPVEFYRASVEFYRASVEFYQAPVEFYRTPVEFYRTSVEVYQTSVEVYGTSILRIISNINPYNLIIMVNYISKALTAFILKRIRTFALTITLSLSLVIPAFAADTTVSNYTDLQGATSAGGAPGDVITLGGNITDGDTQLNIGRTLTLDLNGHGLTITVSSGNGMVEATSKYRDEGIGGGYGDYDDGVSGNILITGENTVITAKGSSGSQDIGNRNSRYDNSMVSNVFVAIPAANLTLTSDDNGKRCAVHGQPCFKRHGHGDAACAV